MRTAASVGMILVAAAVMILVIIPLVAFFAEFFEDPELFQVETKSIVIGDTAYFNITLKYNGDIKLTDFKYVFTVGNENYTMSKPVLMKGDELFMNISVPIQDLGNGEAGYMMSFKIAGIYGFSVGVKGGS